MKIRIQFAPRPSRNLFIRLFANHKDTQIEIQSDEATKPEKDGFDLIELEILMRPA